MRWLVCSIVALAVALLPGVYMLNRGDACMTPSGTPGTCDPVKKCKYVQKLQKLPDFSRYDIEYLVKLKCGVLSLGKRSIPLVCCPKFANLDTCGAQSIGDRITFGQKTKRNEHPWAALLFYKDKVNNTAPRCGGTLVSKRYVITAAHCSGHPNWKLQFVRFNEFNTSSVTSCTQQDDQKICRMDYEVEAITPHPEYGKKQDNAAPHDICILRLATDVEFTNELRPICLPLELDIQKLPIVGETFTVTGWGETENKRSSEIQLHVDLPGLDNEACNSVYGIANVTISDRQLCIGGLNGTDSCRGDSGGPLMRNEAGAWYLVGVVSFGAFKCGTENLPGVYTNVVKYLDWLETVMFVQEYL